MTKRRKAFRWFHCQKPDIIFLQETFSNPESIKIWQNEFGSKIYANHGSNHSKDVAILLNPKLDFKINSTHKDRNGHVIIISIVSEDNTFVIANVYSPNDQNAQVRFYKNVFSLLEPFANDQIILGGELNCCLSSSDKIGGSPVSAKNSVINEVENLATCFNLIDLWRSQHPKEKVFTRRSANKKVC